MKIPGSNDTTGKINVQDSLGLGGNARSVRESKAQVTGFGAEDNQNRARGVDSVTVSPLALLMGEELDPVKMAEERKRRVEDLTQRIAKGEYHPDINQVAGAVGEELSLEILLAGPKS
jgi:anti-sigma28 factor (negative regulator of flagellin synthesis)